MSVTTTIARIATILENIEGVVSVYAGRPNDVPPALFPAFIVLTDAGEIDNESFAANDMALIIRQYRLILLVASWATGIELESEGLCRPFFERVEDAFLQRPGLENPKSLAIGNQLQGVHDARLLSDTGIINIRIAGADFAGVQWVLQVSELRRREYS